MSNPTPSSPWTPFEATFRAGLSVDRLRKYKKSRDRGAWHPMIGRYFYNVELAARLYPVLNWAEITLRNHLHTIISEAFPPRPDQTYERLPSWLDPSSPLLRDDEQKRVRRAIEQFDENNPPPRRPHEKPAKILTEGRLVAELSFGFWTKLLHGQYADWRTGEKLWPELLDRGAFPHCPTLERTRKQIHGRYIALKEFRNRVFHHERILHQADLAMYDAVLETIHWISPVTADTLRATERPIFEKLLRDGPQPFIEWAASKVPL